MKKFETLGKNLSQREMKKITGGVQNCQCTCSGGTGGSWEYNYEPNGQTIASHIKEACSTGTATCTGCRNIYE